MGRLRAAEADPRLLRAYELAAVDIVTEALGDDAYVWDPAYETMTDEERNGFLNDVALGMAPAMLRAALCWALFEGPSPTDWLAQRRPPDP